MVDEPRSGAERIAETLQGVLDDDLDGTITHVLDRVRESDGGVDDVSVSAVQIKA